MKYCRDSVLLQHSYRETHEYEVCFPFQAVQTNGGDHDDEEILERRISYTSASFFERWFSSRTHSQCEDTEIAVPRERASRGSISGPYLRSIGFLDRIAIGDLHIPMVQH